MVERVARRRPSRPEVEVRQRDAVLTVKTSAFGVKEEDRKVIEVEKFMVEPAYVRIEAGATKKIGDYESLRVDVSISVPCYVEEVSEVADRVAGEVEAILGSELEHYGVPLKG